MTTKTKSQPETVTDELILSLGFEATEERRRDHLDFHDVHVLALRTALEKAWSSGEAAGRCATSRQGRTAQ